MKHQLPLKILLVLILTHVLLNGFPVIMKDVVTDRRPYPLQTTQLLPDKTGLNNVDERATASGDDEVSENIINKDNDQFSEQFSTSIPRIRVINTNTDEKRFVVTDVPETENNLPISNFKTNDGPAEEQSRQHALVKERTATHLQSRLYHGNIYTKTSKTDRQNRCLNLNSKQSEICHLIMQADSMLLSLVEEVCRFGDMISLSYNETCQKFISTEEKMDATHTEILSQLTTVVTSLLTAATATCFLEITPIISQSQISGCCHKNSHVESDVLEYANWLDVNVVDRLTQSHQLPVQIPVCIRGSFHYSELVFRVMETLRNTKKFVNTLESYEFILQI